MCACVQVLYSLVTVQRKQAVLTKSLFFRGARPPPEPCCKELALLRAPHPLEGMAFPSLCLRWDMLGVFYLFSFLAILPLLGQAL